MPLCHIAGRERKDDGELHSLLLRREERWHRRPPMPSQTGDHHRQAPVPPSTTAAVAAIGDTKRTAAAVELTQEGDGGPWSRSYCYLPSMPTATAAWTTSSPVPFLPRCRWTAA
nr:hypothetical protein Iba_scaffold5336CG0010 [Ipomoea batatas]